MKVLVVDNYDSFTYNLIHLVEQYADVEVVRNDELDWKNDSFDKVLLSPGPGLPKDAGQLMELLSRWSDSKSIMGVCLGLQAIVEHYGGRLQNLNQVKHGTREVIEVLDPTEPLFKGVPKLFEAGHYHSWIAESPLPDALSLTAQSKEGYVMSLRHEEHDVCGVQFHPESIMTDHGHTIIANWLNK